jgi:hypothetical protein
MTVLIIDVADDPTPRLSELGASGITTIFGYMSSIDPKSHPQSGARFAVGQCWAARW